MVSKNFIGNNSRFKTFYIFVLHTTIALSLRSVFEFEVRASWSLKRIGLQFLAEIYRNPRGEENNCCKTIFCWPLWNLYFVRFVIESSWYTSWCNPVCFKRKIKNDLMTVHITTHTLCNTKNHFSLHFLNSHITLNFNFIKTSNGKYVFVFKTLAIVFISSLFFQNRTRFQYDILTPAYFILTNILNLSTTTRNQIINPHISLKILASNCKICTDFIICRYWALITVFIDV